MKNLKGGVQKYLRSDRCFKFYTLHTVLHGHGLFLAYLFLEGQQIRHFYTLAFNLIHQYSERPMQPSVWCVITFECQGQGFNTFGEGERNPGGSSGCRNIHRKSLANEKRCRYGEDWEGNWANCSRLKWRARLNDFQCP
jgi:hypothetical protein